MSEDDERIDPEDFPAPADAQPMNTAPLGEDIEVWHVGQRYNEKGPTHYAAGWIDGYVTTVTGSDERFVIAPDCDDGFDCMFGGWRPKPNLEP